MSLPNRWHLRKVSPTSSKACTICYKPTSSVLITVDSKDFFYICDGHLLDKGFCTPIIDEEAVKRAAQEAKEREIEQVKKEYEEKQKKKAEKKKKSKEKDEKKDKDQKVDDEGEDAKEEPTKTTKAKDDDGSTTKDKAGEAPRIFSLHKSFYQMRVDRLRNAEVAKRNRDRLRSPDSFPSVPSGGGV